METRMEPYQTVAPRSNDANDTGRMVLGWRWATLVAIVVNVVFNALSEQLGGLGQSLPAITARYPNVFTPAGWAFSIWGVIYAAFLAYAIVGLLPSMRKQPLFDRTAMPLTFANLLASAWIIAFKSEVLVLSQGIIVAMLVLAGLMFNEAQRARREGRVSLWATVPFSLFLAWLSVATVAQTTISLVAAGWQGAPLSEPTWAAILSLIVMLLGLVIALRHRDFVLPLVFGWALIALWDVNQDVQRVEAGWSANVSLAAAIVSLTLALVVAAQHLLKIARRSAPMSTRKQMRKQLGP